MYYFIVSLFFFLFVPWCVIYFRSFQISCTTWQPFTSPASPCLWRPLQAEQRSAAALRRTSAGAASKTRSSNRHEQYGVRDAVLVSSCHITSNSNSRTVLLKSRDCAPDWGNEEGWSCLTRVIRRGFFFSPSARDSCRNWLLQTLEVRASAEGVRARALTCMHRVNE